MNGNISLGRVLLVLLGCLFMNGTAGAQNTPQKGVLAGQVVDAESGLPLPGVTAVLEPATAGALPSQRRGEPPFLRSTISAVTTATGEYRFTELPRGTYRLRFQRPGYRPATVEVELGGAPSRVSVGLTVEPIALEPLRVTTVGANPFGSPGTRAVADSSRLLTERLRQEQFLGSDVRAITHADVEAGVSLAETDLFRSLQRLPGVSTRDDWTAELWTRGAPWDQTRVFFDGLPLFNPLHAFGVFSGVNADAIGAAFLHPGVQPASLGGGAAATLDLRSRRGGGDGDLRGAGELSLASARLALNQQTSDGEHSWMLAGRRTYIDALVSTIGKLGLVPEEEAYLPYSFYDAALRTDHRIGERSTVETSALVSFDAITGTIPDVVHRTDARWGGGAGRVTLATSIGALETRHTLGFSGFDSRTRRLPADSVREAGFSAPEGTPGRNQVRYLSLAGELGPTGISLVSGWTGGYEIVSQHVSYDGPPPVAHDFPEIEEPIARDDRLSYLVGWAEHRWEPRAALSVEAGLRAEAGPSVRNGGPLRLAPRLSARYELSPEVSVSAGLGRSFQYTQALAPTGLSFQRGFTAEYRWLLAGDSTPALRSDIGTLGAEWWMGSSWLGSATAYLRRTTDVLVPNPTPGITLDRPPFVTGLTDARGLEFSARRLAGRWTASTAYTYAVAESEAEGLRFPAPGDRRHVFDATSMLRLGRSWHLGAALSVASGTPYTRRLGGVADCRAASDPETGEVLNPRECVLAEPPLTEAPGAQRNPAYQRLDLLLAWNHAFRSWTFGAFLQLHNALGADNSGGYTGTYETCFRSCGEINGERFGYETIDEFLPGLPRIPVLGFRVSF